MDDYGWVDAGLAQLGFQLDIRPNEVPLECRPVGSDSLSVKSLMKTMPALFDKTLEARLESRSTQGEWLAEIGMYPGSAVVTQKTTLSSVKTVTPEDYLKLLVDDAMLDVARLWDETFQEGGFEYIITNDGKTYKASDCPSLEGIPSSRVAKIMRWVFVAPAMARREIVSVYVTWATKESVFVAYLPVAGSKIPKPTNGTVRGRLMIPCLDRAVFGEDGTSTFEHYASAALMGWMPLFFLNSNFGKKKFLEGAVEEAKHFVELLSKQDELGGKFTAIARRDATSYL